VATPASSAPAAVPAPGAAATPGPSGGATSVFQTLLAREAKTLSKRALALPDGRATGEIEAAADPVMKREGKAWTITVPIGSDIPVTCALYDEPIDGAASLVRLADLIKKAATSVTVQALAPTDAGVIGETAYLAAVLTYTKPTPKGLLGGQMKMFVRPDLDASVMCFHDEVGYAESFKRVAHGLAASLKVKSPSAAPPQFVDIQITSIGPTPVGFDRRTVHLEAGGTRLDQVTSCTLLPRTAKDLEPSDHVGIERIDRDGRLLTVDTVSAHGEELEYEYKLTRQRRTRVYSYKGKQSGKDVTGKFKSKEDKGLASSSLIARRLLDELVTGKAAQLTVEEYHPGISPQPFDVVYKRTGGDAHDVTMRLGQLEANGHLDERGITDRVSIPIAGITMIQRRVFVRGNP